MVSFKLSTLVYNNKLTVGHRMFKKCKTNSQRQFSTIDDIPQKIPTMSSVEMIDGY